MKKFEFRLATLMRLREARLTIERNKLQQLFGERKKLEDKLRLIGDERVEAERWIHEMSTPASSDLRSLSAFLLGSKAREATLKNALQSCEEDVTEQIQQTMLAERNQKLLLKLRDRKQTEWQHEFDKELEALAQESWQSAARSKQH